MSQVHRITQLDFNRCKSCSSQIFSFLELNGMAVANFDRYIIAKLLSKRRIDWQSAHQIQPVFFATYFHSDLGVDRIKNKIKDPRWNTGNPLIDAHRKSVRFGDLELCKFVCNTFATSARTP